MSAEPEQSQESRRAQSWVSSSSSERRSTAEKCLRSRISKRAPGAAVGQRPASRQKSECRWFVEWRQTCGTRGDNCGRATCEMACSVTRASDSYHRTMASAAVIRATIQRPPSANLLHRQVLTTSSYRNRVVLHLTAICDRHHTLS